MSLVTKRIISIVFLWLCVLWSFAVAADQSLEIDPYKNVNQKVFSFNQSLDDNIARPIAQLYTKVTPDFIERGVANMFDNLGFGL